MTIKFLSVSHSLVTTNPCHSHTRHTHTHGKAAEVTVLYLLTTVE